MATVLYIYILTTIPPLHLLHTNLVKQSEIKYRCAADNGSQYTPGFGIFKYKNKRSFICPKHKV